MGRRGRRPRRSGGDRGGVRPGAGCHTDRHAAPGRWWATPCFGLQWLRKAILRASGFKALHDEEAAFAKQIADARSAGQVSDPTRDLYGFTVAFKGVLLEGLEVAFIVVTFGASQGSLGLAIGAALAAVIVVVGIGFVARHPLAQVPENTLKFGVGLLLTSFGTFWAAEGAGVDWPGGDAAIVLLLAFYGLFPAGLVLWLRREREVRMGAQGTQA